MRWRQSVNVIDCGKMVKNPFCFATQKNQDVDICKDETPKMSETAHILFCSLLLLLMIILNLYLLVLLTNYSYDGAYICTTGDQTITKWNLFYYTLITFTTVGYGDVLPNTLASQAVAILIAITNICYVSIFISSVLSEKSKY